MSPRWIVLALALAALACGGPPAPERADAPPADGAAQDPGKPGKQPLFREVTELKATPPNQAEPLPYPAGGLRFQRSSLASESQHRPIGSARYGPNGWIYAGFPKMDLVIAFKRPGYDLVFFGSRGQGGADEIVKNPERIHFIGESMLLTNNRNGQALALSLEGQFETLYETRTAAPIPGPDRQFLVTTPRSLDIFLRVNQRNMPQRAFQLPELPEAASSNRRLFLIFEDWSLATIKNRGSHLFELAESGAATRYFTIDWAASETLNQLDWRSTLTIHGLKRTEGRYWLLIAAGSAAAETLASFILSVGEQDRSVWLWRTPFYADDFDLTDDELLLCNKAEGSIQTFRRR